jgi:hypothetical protein
MKKELFSETQKLQRIWFWVIGLDIVGIVLIFVFKDSSVDISDILPPTLIVASAFLFVIWIFIVSKLIVTIDARGIHYRYPVFRPKWKTIPCEDIGTFSTVHYDAIFDYGGWGIKNSKKNGRCITIQGNCGILLELKNGEKILLGTQNKEGMEFAMKRLMQQPSDI